MLVVLKVQLNYNFISTHVAKRVCKMQKFVMKIKISMRRVVEFSLDEMWNLHKTWQDVTILPDVILDLHI